MSRRNYDKMYEEKNTAPVEEPIVEEAPASEEVVEEKKPAKSVKVPFMGTVTGGLSLNVRKDPNGKIISSLADGAQVRVLNADDPDWYQIEYLNGFVMKKFIKKA